MSVTAEAEADTTLFVCFRLSFVSILSALGRIHVCRENSRKSKLRFPADVRNILYFDHLYTDI